jgi:hypothetical protein
MEENILITGKLKGSVSDLSGKNIRINAGSHTELRGDIHLMGLRISIKHLLILNRMISGPLIRISSPSYLPEKSITRESTGLKICISSATSLALPSLCDVGHHRNQSRHIGYQLSMQCQQTAFDLFGKPAHK